MSDQNKLKTLLAKEMPGVYKYLFNEEPPAATAPPDAAQVQLGAGKTSDGKALKWEGTLSQGTSILMSTAEGDISIPDGQYTMEDGTAITTVGGQVTEIGAPTMPEMMSKEEVEAAISTALSAQKEEFAKQLKTIQDSHTEEKKGIQEKFSAIYGVLELIANVDNKQPDRADDPKQKSASQSAQNFSRLQNAVTNLSKK